MTQINSDGKSIIFITGQSGMLGQQITQSLSDKYHIHSLKRKNLSPNNPSWNYRESLAELNIKAPDIVIHLAGAGIADKRWSKKYKQTIYDSRVYGTKWLVDEVMLYEQRPKAFLCASAIGYYGHRPNEKLNEDSEPGNNFVAQISQQWEAATNGLKDTETRLINLRFGMILSATGGALKDMLLPYKLGLGGRLGDGQQQYSWISIHDAIKAIDYLINQPSCEGVYNLTSPQSVTNQQFTQVLAKTLNRPAFMHMPAFMVRLVFGEVADELLLADAQVEPQRLMAAGFEFDQANLSQALHAIMK
jgi:uncharacterized protein (TIGR01777 family)